MNGAGAPLNRRSCGLVLTAVGIVAVVAGALQLGDADVLADQVSYLVSSGIGGLVLIMTGVTLVASAGARAEVSGRLTRIEANIRSTRGDVKL